MRFSLLVLLCMVIFLCSCLKDSEKEVESAVVESRYFKTAVVTPSLRPVVISGYGFVDTVQRYFLYPQVQAEVVQKVSKDGEVVQQGDEILRLDSSVQEIHLQSLRALAEERRMEYQAAKDLHESGYLPAAKFSGALAGLKKAEADLKALENQIEKHIIRAPVSGVLSKINVSHGDLVSPGVTLLGEIIPFGDYLVRIKVSERNILTLKEGLDAEIELSGLGDCRGKVKFVSLVPDTATRTFPVEIKINQGCIGESIIPVGTTAQVKVIIEKRFLYRVPASALVLDKDNNITMKVISEGAVKSVHVEVIEEEGEWFWISQDALKGEVEVVVVGSSLLIEDKKL
ncbi:efflux transporter, RND family, MFP subunit [Neorickettsia helminthoeca str. Oregon]|uniref:Efflux transporter, RND family, MFP subunit n=1 Tax=Neorickettsia helminthoeca str. Oregon TaxID=1286528 RepID=X5H3H6_9RICK|nr:efflux RND transporter periplasmic adaptor subunit [Neorickettsia helminthoeca]AHX11106.1 efflux transporter, RND family, MFP subunit [Neorickettsia helminthoeca str. Oregon]